MHSNNTEIIMDREIYERLILALVPNASRSLWIATADIKDMYIQKSRIMAPFLGVLAELLGRGVDVRLIHAREPGPAFRRDFDRYEVLIRRLDRMLCPRVHFKSVIIDGRTAYTGSANLTGAGMGAKSDRRRNFETGILTTEPRLVGKIMRQFELVWDREPCCRCERKGYCPD